MAALVAVAGVNTGADQTVADIVTGAQGGFHIGAVVGVNVHGIVRTASLSGGNQLAHQIVAVRTATILGADADLPLAAVQSIAHAAHIHGNGFGDSPGNRSAAAVIVALVLIIIDYLVNVFVSIFISEAFD